MPKISVIYKRGEENMKTVLVTGSSRGLGASVIEYFASKGYNTIINYHSSKRCAEDLKEYIENTYKVKAYVYKCDVSKEDKVKGLFNKIKNDIGNIDSAFKNEEISKILLERFASKEEIADAIYFLASNSYINDTVLKIDGGTK